MTSERSPREWSLAVRQQAAVAHLSQFGLQASELGEVLHEAIVVLADTLDASDVALFEVEGDHIVGRAGIYDGRTEGRASMSRLRTRTGSGSLPAYALAQGTTIVSSDLEHDPRFETMAKRYGVPVRAGIAAPIAWEGHAFGTLAAYARELREWTPDEAHFVQSVANTVGLAVQRLAVERSLRDSTARLDLSLEAGGLGAWSWDATVARLALNSTALDMFGLTHEPYAGDADRYLALVHPDDRDLLADGLADALERGAEHRITFRIVRPDSGELRWIESWGRVLFDEHGEGHLVGVCADVTEQRRAEEAREASLKAEQEARVEAEQARERLAFLSEASRVLATSLEPEVTLVSLADLCVPDLADVCFIDLVDEDGLLAQQVARATTEPLLHDGQALRRRRAELAGDAPTRSGHDDALAGQAVLFPAISDEQLERAAVDQDHLRLLRRFDARSTVLAPLVTRGRVIGVLTLVRTGQREEFAADDLGFLEELAGRAALGIDNGRLFRSRNRVARSLQAALLPPALPAAPGLAMAARYDVAEADVAIGGDFYDVIALAPHRWGVVVGDVCGRGPDAAALTGLVRHTLRTAVVSEDLPSRVLGQTNEAVIRQIDESKFCTAAYVRLEVGDGPGQPVRVVAASAGHPRPVLVRADGSAEVLECTGTLLGVVEDMALRDIEAHLLPGDSVVLYTDGVTEARRGHEQFGEQRLLDTLSGLAGLSADEVAGGLEAAVASFRRSARDDTAILVVQAVDPA